MPRFFLSIISIILFYFNTTAQIEPMKIYNKYMPIDLGKDSTFISYFNRFRATIISNNKNDIFEFIKDDLPIMVSIEKHGNNQQTSRVKITNKETFFALYAQIFDLKMRNLIKDQRAKDAKLMVQGIMLGKGQIWWHYYKTSKKIKVSSIANLKIIYQ